MDQVLLSSDPEKIAGLFLAAYILLWCGCLPTMIWLASSSLLCVFYIRFALSLDADHQKTIPPVTLIVASMHWMVAYLSVFCNFR